MIFSHRTFYTLAHLFLSWVGPTRLLEDYRLQVFAVSDQRETLNRRRVEFLGMQKGDGLFSTPEGTDSILLDLGGASWKLSENKSSPLNWLRW